MRVVINEEHIFSFKEKEIIYYSLNKFNQEILNIKENIFFKNKLIISELEKILKEKKIIIKGLLEESELRRIIKKIAKEQFKIIDSDINIIEEISSYNLVLDELIDKTKKDFNQINSIYYDLKIYFKKTSPEENIIISKKKDEINLNKKEIKELEKHYTFEKTKIRKKFLNFYKKIDTEIKKLENDLKKNNKNQEMIDKFNMNIKRLETKIIISNKRIKIYHLKKICYSPFRIFLFIITLGLAYWFGIFDCKKMIEKEKLKINKLKEKIIEDEIKIKELNYDNDLIQNINKKIKKLKEERKRIEKEELMASERLNVIKKKIESKNEKLIRLQLEYENLLDNSTSKIDKKIKEIISKIHSSIDYYKSLKNKLEKQKLNLKIGINKAIIEIDNL